MRSGGSKAKGTAFEVDTAKKLSYWVSGGKDAYVFRRTFASGGAARDKRAGLGNPGDIYPDNQVVGGWLTDHYFFELKHYKDIHKCLWAYMLGDSNIINGILSKALVEAVDSNRVPFVIIKPNHQEAMCFIGDDELGGFHHRGWYINKFKNVLKLDINKFKNHISREV